MTRTDVAKPPRISVIIIFLNAQTFLAEAIESVLFQTCQDFELLLCDDGSSDDGVAIARGYADRLGPKVRYLDHPGHLNRGMSATRNLGIDEALGEFIAFIDADDMWRPTKLADQMAILDENPGLAMVCGAVNYWSSWEGGLDEVVPTGPVRDRVMAAPEALLTIYPLGKAAAPCPSDLLLRTEAVRAVGGFEAHFTGPRMMYEDQGFLNKLYLQYPVYFSSHVWLDYRQHEDSCVAEVHRAGQYAEVRGYFLSWFKDYITRQEPPADPRAVEAVDRALRRHGRRNVFARARALTGRLGRLPGHVLARLQS